MKDVVDRDIFTRFEQNSTYLLSYPQLRQMPSLSRLQTATDKKISGRLGKSYSDYFVIYFELSLRKKNCSAHAHMKHKRFFLHSRAHINRYHSCKYRRLA